MRKLIAFLLSFSIIFTSVTPSLAQGIVSHKKVQSFRQTIEQAFKEQIQAKQSQEKQILQVFQQVEHLINPPKPNPKDQGSRHYLSAAAAQTASDVLLYCSVKMDQAKDAFQSTKEEGTDFLSDGYVCTEEQTSEGVVQSCSNALIFAQACSAVALGKRYSGKGFLPKKQYRVMTLMPQGPQQINISAYAYRPLEENLLSPVKGDDFELTSWLAKYGIIRDYEKAFNYLKQILAIPDVCDAIDEKNDVIQKNSSECFLTLEALSALAGLALISSDYTTAATQTIFNYLVKKHREKMGATVTLRAIWSLMAINTDLSYRYLKQFLTEEARPTKMGTALQEMSMFSIEGVSKLAEQSGSHDARYLNNYTRSFDYADKELIETWWYRGAYWLYGDSVVDFQFPYANIYEDIGSMIALDSLKNPRSQQLAQAIWNDATGVNYLGRYPQPLFLGLLFAGYGGEKAEEKLDQVIKTNFVDLNEGTQRRLKMKANYAKSYKGKVQNTSHEDFAALAKSYKLKKDQDKFDEYARWQRMHAIALGGDIILMFVLLPMLIKSTVSLGTRAYVALGQGLNQTRKLAVQTVKVTQKTIFKSVHKTQKAFSKPAAVKTVSTNVTAAKAAAPAAKATSPAATATTATQTKGATAALELYADGSYTLKTIPVQPSQATQQGLKVAQTTTAIGDGGSSGAGIFAGTTKAKYVQASQTLKLIKSEADLLFKGTYAEPLFQSKVNLYLGQARAAKLAAGRGSSRLSLLDKTNAFQRAFADMGKEIEFLQSSHSALNISSKIPVSSAASAFSWNLEMGGLAATRPLGQSARIWTQADIPWFLRARVSFANAWQNIKLTGQGFARAATNKYGQATLLSLAGITNPALTTEAIQTANLFSNISKPAIVLVQDTKHIGSMTSRVLTAPKLQIPTAPVTLSASQLPLSSMPFNVAHKALVPVFLGMGLKSYDQIFSEKAIAQAFQQNPEAALTFYTYDKFAEQNLFRAYSSTVPVKVAPVEIVETAAKTTGSLVTETAQTTALPKVSSTILNTGATTTQATAALKTPLQAAAVAGATAVSLQAKDFDQLLPKQSAQIPPIPLQAEKGVFFRGMALPADGVALRNILENGLLVKDVSSHAASYLTSLAGASGNYGAMRGIAQLSKNINLTNSPTEAANWAALRGGEFYGKLLVVTVVEGLDAVDQKTINYFQDIPAENIREVWVLIQDNGTPVWAKVQAKDDAFEFVYAQQQQKTNTPSESKVSPVNAPEEKIAPADVAKTAVSTTKTTLKDASWFQQASIYFASFVMGLEIATPIMSSLGKSLELSLDKNILVTAATYLPFSIGGFIANWFKGKIGRKGSLNLGLALMGAALAFGTTILGLDGSFAPWANPTAQFNTILLTLLVSSFGAVLVHNSVGPIITEISQNKDEITRQKRASFVELGYASGIMATFAFPFISNKILNLDWSASFFIALPFIALAALGINLSKLPNTKPQTLQKKSMPPLQPAQNSTGLKSIWASLAKNSYVQLLKEEKGVAKLLGALLLINAIEISFNSGFLLMLPSLTKDPSSQYLFGLIAFSAPLVIGRMLASKILQKFPNKNLTVSGTIALVGALSSLLFTNNVYALTATLFLAQLGFSSVFTLAYARTAKNRFTQDRITSLIMSSGIACALGPVFFGNLAQGIIDANLLPVFQATIVGLLAAPAATTILAALLLRSLEKTKPLPEQEKTEDNLPASSEK